MEGDFTDIFLFSHSSEILPLRNERWDYNGVYLRCCGTLLAYLLELDNSGARLDFYCFFVYRTF